MKITTHLTCAGVAPAHLAYSATSEDYDGAPDANAIDRLIGRGPTPEAATEDLVEQLDSWDSEWRDHYGTIESAECNMLRDTRINYTGELCATCARPDVCREHGPCDRVKPAHDGTCEHGHPNCNPVSDKCGDECD